MLRTADLDSLSQGGETMAALACRLGFSEPSAFTRAFRRWTGDSPTAFLRCQLRAS
jgi:AraC-like DNA-binding protein